MSLDSFTSAYEDGEQPLIEVDCKDFKEHFILLPAVLLSKYKSHLTQMKCEHWVQNDNLTEQATRKLSLMQNLKVRVHYCMHTLPQLIGVQGCHSLYRNEHLITEKP